MEARIAPAVVITISDGVSEVHPGDTITYTVNYENTDPLVPAVVAITDILPLGAVFDSLLNPNWTLDAGLGTLLLNVGSILGGGSGSASLTLKVPDVVPAGADHFVNAINALQVVLGEPLTQVVSDVNDLIAAPDLHVVESHGAISNATVGDVLTYTINFANNGDQGATGVVLTQIAPLGTTFNAALSSPGWTETGPGTGVFQLTIGGLNGGGAGGARTFAVTVNDSVGAGQNSLAASIRIGDDSANGDDPNGLDNVVNDLLDLIAAPDLSLTQTDNVETVAPGQMLTYVFNYANHGTQGASGVKISELLAVGASFDQAANPGWSLDAGTLRYTVGNLAAGATGTATLVLKADDLFDLGVGVVAQSATISDDGANGVDLNVLNNVGVDIDVVLAAPDLSVTQTDHVTTVAPGQTLTYEFNYANLGTQGASGVKISELLAVDVSFDPALNPGWTLDSGTLTFDIGNLAAGAMGTATLILKAHDLFGLGVGAVVHSATISNDGTNGADLNLLNNVSADADVVLAAPDLSITLGTDLSTILPGDTITYTLNYSNIGTKGASGVMISENLPLGTSFDAAANPGWSLAGGVLSFEVGDVEAGASGSQVLVLHVDNTLAAGIGRITSTATIADDGANGLDLDVLNNISLLENLLDAAPDLTLTNTTGLSALIPGQQVSFTLHYTNNGTQGASGVNLSEPLPLGFSFDVALNSGWSLTDGVLHYSIGAVAAGGSGDVALVLKVDDTIGAGVGSLTTIATIADDGSNGLDLKPLNNIALLEHVLEAAPDLSITQTNGITSTTVGGTLTYTLNYANHGTQGSTGVTITEVLPAGTSFDPAANTGWTLDGDLLTFHASDLAAGATGSTTLVLKVNNQVAAGLNAITSTVNISDDGANGSESNTLDNSATDTDTLDGAAPDLSLTISDGVSSTSRNSTLTYTLNYSNTGNQGASGVTITETLPAGMTFDGAQNPGWTLDGDTLTFQLGTVEAGANGSTTLVLKVSQELPQGTTTLANTATIADDGANGADATPTNNTATDTDAIVAAPDLKLTATDGVSSTTPGSTLTYTFNYENAGDADATGVVITETLPAGMVFDAGSNSGWTKDGNTLTYTVGNLAAGADDSVTLVLTVATAAPAGVNSIVNSATISATGGGTDANPSDNIFTDTNALDAAPDLTLTLSDGAASVHRGETISYTLNYGNDGNQDASGVAITETLPVGVTFDGSQNPGWTLDGDTLTFDIGNLNAGATGTATLILKVNGDLSGEAVSIDTTATIVDDGSGGADSTPLDNSATESTPVLPSADLTLAITDGVSAAGSGDTLTYTLTYANAGTAAASGVVITEALPAGTTFNAAENTGWTLNNGVLTYDVGAVENGADGTATLVLHVAPGATPAGVENIVSTASIADDGSNGIDPTPENNTATDSDNIDAAADLTLTNSDGVSTAGPGDTLTYTLNYANNGNQDAAGVHITETLPAGMSFDPAQNSGWTLNGSTLTFDIGNLAAGGTGSATLKLSVNASVPAGQTTLVSTASIADDGNSGPDANPLDNSVTDTNTLSAGADLVLTTTDNATSAAPGSTLTYHLAYSNAGNQDAAGVVITQQLPAGTTFNAAGSAAGWTETSPGVYQLNVGTVAGGGNGTTTFAVTVAGAIPAGQTNIVSTASIADDGLNGVDPTPENNTATDTDTVGAAPNLHVTATTSTSSATRNGLLTYALTYSNTGDQDATGVFLTETLPANMTFVSGGSTAGWAETSAGSGVYRFEVGDLGAGESVTINFQVRAAATLPSSLLQITSTATIGDDGTNGVDPNTSDNTATLNTPVYKGIYVAAMGRSNAHGHLIANGGSQVKVYDIATGNVVHNFAAYEADAKRGVRVAVGDFNGDGYDDVVTAYASGSGRVRVFDGLTGQRLSIGGVSEFNPFDAAKNSGAFVAVGDITGDGRPDIVVGEGWKGNRVSVYDGVTGQVVKTFKPFGDLNGGVRVAVGDTNGDGRADLIVSQRSGGDEVRVFNGKKVAGEGPLKPMLGFHTGAAGIAGDVFVGAGNVAGDSKAEILTSGGLFSPGKLHILAGNSGASVKDANVFPAGPTYGIRVSAVDVNFDGVAEVIAGAGLGGKGQVRFINGRTGGEMKSLRITPFEGVSKLGVAVAGTVSIPAALNPA